MLHCVILALLLFGQNPGTLGCEALQQSARHAMQARQFDVAIQSFQSALSACPADRRLQIALGNAYFMGGHFQQAKDVALKILRSDPGNAAALEIKANSEYLLGDSGAAIDTFIGLLDRHPENESAAYMLGRIYYQEDSIDQAIGQFERVLRLNAYSYKAYDNLGLCYEAKGDNEKATRYFLTAIKLVEKNDPDYDTVYADLAELLLKTGDTQKAFDAASIAANRNSMSARNFYLGGKALDQLGKTKLALNWLQRSAALDPNYPQPLYLLSRIYHKLGEKQKAEKAQKKFIELQAKLPVKRR